MTNLNKEQIEFIDKLFVNLYKGEDRHELFRNSEYKTPEFDYLNNYALDLAEELGLVVLDKTIKTNRYVVVFHKIPCDNFINNGGFKAYLFSKYGNAKEDEAHEKRVRKKLKLDIRLLWLTFLVLPLIMIFKDDIRTLSFNQTGTQEPSTESEQLNQSLDLTNPTHQLQTLDSLNSNTDSLNTLSLDTINTVKINHVDIDSSKKKTTHNKVFRK